MAQLVRLDPEKELKFLKSNATASPSASLTLTNSSGSGVAYKVKTTVPKSYLVRPSGGHLQAGETAEVQIILQPSGEAPAATHRFLVQATASEANLSREEWADISANSKEKIQEQRLNVAHGDAATSEPARTNVAPASATRSLAGAGGDDELKSKYDELVQKALSLEQEKKALEQKIANQKGSSQTKAAGFSAVQLLLVFILTAILSYIGRPYIEPHIQGLR